MMPAVTARAVRPNIGYESLEAMAGVRPTLVTPTPTSVFVEFADPAVDLDAVREWMETPDDDVMAMRATIRAALAALDALPPLPPSPTDQSRIARLETQVGALRAVLEPLVYMALGTNA